MVWSLANDNRSAFQSKTRPTDETKAALRAYRAEQEAQLQDEARKENPDSRLLDCFCGPLSGWGIPRPPFDLEMVIHMRPRDLPNVVAFSEGWLVNAKIRDVIEWADPGVHGFWPISLKWKNGADVPEEYWLLNIGARKQTIVEESSKVVFKRDAKGELFQVLCVFEKAGFPDSRDPEAKIQKNPLPIFVSKVAIGTSNLWTERFFGYKAPVAILATDSLFQSLKAADAKVLRPEAYIPEM